MDGSSVYVIGLLASRSAQHVDVISRLVDDIKNGVVKTRSDARTRITALIRGG